MLSDKIQGNRVRGKVSYTIAFFLCAALCLSNCSGPAVTPRALVRIAESVILAPLNALKPDNAMLNQPKPDLSKAAGLLENAAGLEPDNADVHLNLAQIYDKLNEDTKAISEFNRAIELSDDGATLVSAHLGLMAVYKKQGELEKADEQYNAAYRIFPGVEQMLKQAEIDRITPAPRYVGSEFREDTGTHPSLEARIERSQQEVSKIKEEKDE